jgi:replicative DNA helicase
MDHLHNLHREIEQLSFHDPRGGTKEPVLADLPGADMIEALADDVLLLYRPYYYGIIEDAQGRDSQNLTKILVAKNKTGQSQELYYGLNREILNWLN